MAAMNQPNYVSCGAIPLSKKGGHIEMNTKVCVTK